MAFLVTRFVCHPTKRGTNLGKLGGVADYILGIDSMTSSIDLVLVLEFRNLYKSRLICHFPFNNLSGQNSIMYLYTARVGVRWDKFGMREQL